MVKVEMKDSWSWFSTYLLEDIGPMEEYDWTFMFNRQRVSICCLIHIFFSTNIQ